MSAGRWAPLALVAAGLGAWGDALAGGSWASGAVGTALVLVTAAVAGRFAGAAPLALAAAAATTLLSLADQVAAPGQFSLANDGVFYAVLVGGPAAAGWLVGERSRQLTHLRLRTEELERRRPLVLEAARAEEAARVERRVDRALAGRLDALVAGIHAAGDDPRRVAAVEREARAALEELRDVLGVLGPSVTTAERPAARRLEPPRSRRVDLADLLLTSAGIPLAVESGDVLLSLAQGVLLPVVRRRPVAGTAALMAVSAVQSALLTPVPPLVTWLLPGLLTAFLIGRTRRRADAWSGLVVAVAGVLAVTVVTPAGQRDESGLAPSLGLGVLAWWAGRVVVARERRATELAAVAGALARAEEAATRLAAAEQRAALTRELHDVGAHALTVVCLQAGAAQRVRDPDQARAAVATLTGLADGTLTALRASLGSMEADDSLEPLAELGRALGLRVELSVSGGSGALPEEVTLAAYRIVQESLTNAARHAPRSTVHVVLRHDAAALEVTVTDDGPGTGPAEVPVSSAGIGLVGMRHRVEALSGELSYGRRGDGFEVRARLPVPA